MKARVFVVRQFHGGNNDLEHAAALVFATDEEQAKAAVPEERFYAAWGEPQFVEIGEVETSDPLPIVMDPEGVWT